MSATRWDLVTIDTPSVDRLAAFYSAALGLTESEREDGDRWVVLSSTAGERRIGFQRGAHRPGGVHLDLACAPGDFGAEVDRLVALGARLVSPVRVEPYGSIANLADPDGNLLDLCAYR